MPRVARMDKSHPVPSEFGAQIRFLGLVSIRRNDDGVTVTALQIYGNSGACGLIDNPSFGGINVGGGMRRTATANHVMVGRIVVVAPNNYSSHFVELHPIRPRAIVPDGGSDASDGVRRTLSVGQFASTAFELKPDPRAAVD
jgi:hypothetical protein